MPHRACTEKREGQYEKERGIKGRLRMNKAQLEKVLNR
jgi:hypothetical protein